MSQLCIPPGSRASVRKVCTNILASQAKRQKFNAKLTRKRLTLSRADSDEASLVLHALETGLSINLTTVLLNIFRASRSPPLRAVSWYAVKSFLNKSKLVIRSRRGFKKSDKDDPAAAWSKARLAQMIQFKEMLRFGALPATHSDLLASQLAPLKIESLALWDGKHQKVVLGHASKYEVHVSRNPIAQMFGQVYLLEGHY